MLEIIREPDFEGVVTEAAKRFAEVVQGVQETGGVSGDGIARVVITGGSDGIGLLKKLRTEPNIDWKKVHIFWGDERNVPVTDPESNEGQARDALFDHVDIPEENLHGMGLGTGISLSEAAKNYQEVLSGFASEGFDLHLLGMGPEGHINSLFPHSAARAEKDALVVPVKDSPKPPPERLTLTMPAINSAVRVWLLVSSGDKAEAVAHVANGDSPEEWPAAGVKGAAETLLFVSEAAAAQLPKK